MYSMVLIAGVPFLLPLSFFAFPLFSPFMPAIADYVIHKGSINKTVSIFFFNIVIGKRDSCI